MLKVKSLVINEINETCGDINLILGSNNSGKSSFINDLQMSLGTLEIRPENKWIKQVGLEIGNLKKDFNLLFPGILNIPGYDLATESINKLGLASIYGSNNWNNHVFNDLNKKSDDIYCLRIVKNSPKDANYYFFQFFTNVETLSERCDQRLIGPFDATINRVSDAPSNFIHFIHSKREIFNEIASEIKKVFGLDIAFDDLQQGVKYLRLKPVLVPTKDERYSQEKLSQFWDKNSSLVAFLGDGVKAYIKILYALYNPAKSLILIDEPEAFLHPPQRRSLGQFIANHSSSKKQIFIATHDSEILRGILSGKKRNIKIFHLKNDNEVYSHSSIEGSHITSGHSRNISEPILNAFFYERSIVCESQDDRVVYQAAAEKLSKNESIDLNFIGSNGKAEAIKWLTYLNSIDLNARCILDIDALYSNEILSKDINYTIQEKIIIKNFQRRMNVYIKENVLKVKLKNVGLKAIKDPALRKESLDTIKLLEKYRIHIVPCGELESWFIAMPKDISKPMQWRLNFIEKTKISKMKILPFIKKVVTS